MANQLIHVTNFPYNSVVVEQYLLVFDGKKVASVAFVTRDSAIGDDAIEVKIGDNEPYEVIDLEDALADLTHKFGYVNEAFDITFDLARVAKLIG